MTHTVPIDASFDEASGAALSVGACASVPTSIPASTTAPVSARRMPESVPPPVPVSSPPQPAKPHISAIVQPSPRLRSIFMPFRKARENHDDRDAKSSRDLRDDQAEISD